MVVAEAAILSGQVSGGAVKPPVARGKETEPDPWRLTSQPRALIGSGVVIALGLGISSVFAFLVTSYQCDPTTVHFVQAVPADNETGYCKATHFPGVPNSLGSILLVAAIFALPVAVAFLGAALAARTRSKAIFRVSSIAAVVLAILSWVLVTQAGVSTPGHG